MWNTVAVDLTTGKSRARVLTFRVVRFRAVRKRLGQGSIMAWFDPSPAQISLIEQIETAYYDTCIQERERRQRLEALWTRLETMHGDRVLHLMSPEGHVIRSPHLDD